jgi:hypothetical protein
MNNVTYLDVPQSDGSTLTFAIIDRGNGEYTSMPKATYDAQIAAQSTFPSNSAIPVEKPAK